MIIYQFDSYTYSRDEIQSLTQTECADLLTTDPDNVRCTGLKGASDLEVLLNSGFFCVADAHFRVFNRPDFSEAQFGQFMDVLEDIKDTFNTNLADTDLPPVKLEDFYANGKNIIADFLELAKFVYDGHVIELRDEGQLQYDVFIRYTDCIKIGRKNLGQPGFEWCFGGDF